MKASTIVHAAREGAPEHGLGRVVCGLITGDHRRTLDRRKVTCKRCRQLLGMTTGKRKPPKRVEPVGSKPLHEAGRALGRGLAALLGEPKLPPGKIAVDEAQLDKLQAVYKLASELCDAIDAAEEDVGGCRPIKTILGELGPAVDAVKGR